jgi:putative DNA primase/helicase
MTSPLFKTIADTALSSAEALVSQWLSDGKREGHEWSALNPMRADSRRGSFKVNLTTGMWADFSCGDKGGDLISLYAYLFCSGDQGEALKALAAQFGISLRDIAPPAPAKAGGEKPSGKKSLWIPIVPVPPSVIDAPGSHFQRGQPEMRWAYRNQAGELLGWIYRFKSSDGGKEILPCVFARHEETGESKWCWIQWRDPRPLYFPAPLREGKKIIIPEGEKSADAAHVLFGSIANVCSWPGGSKAVNKADWTPIAGYKVVIWPDCDAKREPLTKAEKDSGVDPASKPYLPEHKQPGIVAAEQIAQILIKLGCEVRIINIPAPGDKPDGWDVADALAEGMTPEAALEFVRNLRAPAPATATPSTPDGATAEGKKKTRITFDDWRDGLIQKPRGGLEDCYQNVYLTLRYHPLWKDCIAYDEFAGRAVKLRPTPAGTDAGEWNAYDDQCLGLWLAQHMNIVIKGDGPVANGVAMIAQERNFHPVRAYLDSLKWDGVERLNYWLEECLSARPVVVGEEYLCIAGTKFLIGAVARIYRPGCKMDTMMVFEGGQGRGKSTAIRILGGEWFSDTHLDLQNKDCYLALNGVWFYEIAEMDSFNRAETTRVKAFVSSSSDRYRVPFERREINRPRQVVFLGTTNQDEYLKDTTGNRRTWPVRSYGLVNLKLLREWRDQLFAEAVVRFKAGEIWYPTSDEQERLFKPEQDFRTIPDPWESILGGWLETEEATLAGKLTVDLILLKGIKLSPDRIGGAKQEAMRIASIMPRLGYRKLRESSGQRRYYYQKTRDGDAPAPALTTDGSDDDLPL